MTQIQNNFAEWEDFPIDPHATVQDATVTPSEDISQSEEATEDAQPSSGTPEDHTPPTDPSTDTVIRTYILTGRKWAVDTVQSITARIEPLLTLTVAWTATKGALMEVLRQRVILPSLLWLISILSVVLVGVLGPAMSPVCTIPGVSRVCHLSVRAAPILSPANVSTPMLADFPALMNTVKHFEVLLDQTELLPVVSLNMKTAELSTRDLATTIRYSDLKTSEDLCARLVEFADAARATGPKLDKFSVKVGGVVDDIVAVTNYARRSILAAKSDSVSWWPGKREVSSALELSLQFSAAMALVTKKLDVLIMFAQVLLSELDGMEVKLQLVSDMAEREDTGVQSRAINVRASLWTQLGGHKHALARLDKAKVSIRAVVQYRKDATARVVGALRILNGISNDVEALRGRVSESALVGHMIPVEEQVRSIDEGVQRLLGKKDGVRAARQEASRVTLLEDGQGRWLTVVGEE